MNDRRRHPRIAADLEARVQFASEEELAVVRTLDVSLEGVFLVGQAHPQGTPVRCTLVDDSGGVHTVAGTVARVLAPGGDVVRKGGVGVHLSTTSEGWRAFLGSLEGDSVVVVDDD